MSNVNLSTGGLPETILISEPTEALEALEKALAAGTREAVADVAKGWPTFLDAWARLGDFGRDDMEKYAAYRVGYHRGLDKLRQSGWRGSGYVKWENESNRGFLRALNGLYHVASAIGETEEADRCRTFLAQLDPDLDPKNIV